MPTATALTIVGKLPVGVTFTDNGDGTGHFSGISPSRPFTKKLTVRATSGVATTAQVLSFNNVASVPIPTITSLSATSGSTNGNMAITVTGAHLSSVTSVQFGDTNFSPWLGLNGSIARHLSDTQIVVIDPPGWTAFEGTGGSTGPVDVVVGTTAGTFSDRTPADVFRYDESSGPFPRTVTGTDSGDSTGQEAPPVPAPFDTWNGRFSGQFTLDSSCLFDNHDGFAPTNIAACYTFDYSGAGQQAFFFTDGSLSCYRPLTWDTGSSGQLAGLTITTDSLGQYHVQWAMDGSTANVGYGCDPGYDATLGAGFISTQHVVGQDGFGPDLYTPGQTSLASTGSLADQSSYPPNVRLCCGTGLDGPGYSDTTQMQFGY